MPTSFAAWFDPYLGAYLESVMNFLHNALQKKVLDYREVTFPFAGFAEDFPVPVRQV
jgi:hypothetical protein